MRPLLGRSLDRAHDPVGMILVKAKEDNVCRVTRHSVLAERSEAFRGDVIVVDKLLWCSFVLYVLCSWRESLYYINALRAEL